MSTLTYSCNWDLIYKANGRAHIEMRRMACYAELFRMQKTKAETLNVHYWLHKDADVKLVEKYVEGFIKRPTKRVNYGKQYTIAPCCAEEEIGDSCYTEPWITVSVNLKKICVFDLYVLLCLFRYPQEYEFFATGYDTAIRGGELPDEAFVHAHTSHDNDMNSGHALLSARDFYDLDIHRRYSNFDFIKCWDNGVSVGGEYTETPYSKSKECLQNLNYAFSFSREFV